ncbi:putative ribonuclease P/MRP protein subunit RPP20 [Paratrimastix pyriformis]|uniref:Ribonuclease P/MRP protein subunit RPP20 n=1 Tax=Paratrimastix pyriformis TaxID=342808 RepID=A0ABQ8UTW7_9EUKA|nr:putative ribonuclease P/MRP protein subunit RPP20 [Paratrimastix pyriformis]
MKYTLRSIYYFLLRRPSKVRSTVCQMEIEQEREKNESPPETHLFVKRAPLRPDAQKNDIWISRGHSLAPLLPRFRRLLFQDKYSEIRIHAMGAAIFAAVKISLQLQRTYPNALQLRTETSTVQLFDDYVPLTEDAEMETGTRYNSAIHITVSRVDQTSR